MATCPQCKAPIGSAPGIACLRCGASLRTGSPAPAPQAGGEQQPIRLTVLDENIVQEAPPPERNRVFHPTPPGLDPEVRREVKTPDLAPRSLLPDLAGKAPMLSLILVTVLAGVVFALGSLLPKHIVLRPELQVRQFLKAARQKDWATMYHLSAGAEKAFATEAGYAAAMTQFTGSEPGTSVYGAVFAGRPYKVGHARIAGSSATVPIRAAGVASAPGIDVQLEKRDGIWKISDSGDFGQLAAGKLPQGAALQNRYAPGIVPRTGGYGGTPVLGGRSGAETPAEAMPGTGADAGPPSGQDINVPSPGGETQSPEAAPSQQKPQGGSQPAEGSEQQASPQGQQPGQGQEPGGTPPVNPNGG